MTPATGRRGLQRPWATEEGVAAGPPRHPQPHRGSAALDRASAPAGHGAATAPGRAGGGVASNMGAEGEGGLEPGTVVYAPFGVPCPVWGPGALLPAGRSGGR